MDSPLIRVRLDPTCTYAAVASADRSVRLIDLAAGTAVAGPVRGHAEAVAGLAFMGDLGRLVTASRDGCVFVWRLPAPVVGAMRTAALAVWPPTSPAKVEVTATSESVSAPAKKAILQAEEVFAAADGVPSRRPTIYDLKPQPQSAANRPAPQPATGVQAAAGGAAEEARRRAAFLSSLLDESHRHTLQIEGSCASSADAAKMQPTPSTAPAAPQSAQPALQIHSLQEQTSAPAITKCESEPGQLNWAARRDQSNAPAGEGHPLDDLCVEELDVEARCEGPASVRPGKVGSGLGELEDDEDEDEDNSVEDTRGGGVRANRGAATIAASQEAQDFQVSVPIF